MATLTKADLIAKYNSTLTGLFKGNSTKDIGSDDLRAMVQDFVDSFEHFRGAYDASVDAYPSAGGSGTSGVIQAGDEWVVSISGDLNINGLGVTTVFAGTLIKALVNTPGTTPANWRVVQ